MYCVCMLRTALIYLVMAFWFGRGRRRSKGCLGLYRRYHVCNTQVLTHSRLIADALAQWRHCMFRGVAINSACASIFWFAFLFGSCRAQPAISGRRSAPPSTPDPSEDAPFAGGPSSMVREYKSSSPPLCQQWVDVEIDAFENYTKWWWKIMPMRSNDAFVWFLEFVVCLYALIWRQSVSSEFDTGQLFNYLLKNNRFCLVLRSDPRDVLFANNFFIISNLKQFNHRKIVFFFYTHELVQIWLG